MTLMSRMRMRFILFVLNARLRLLRCASGVKSPRMSADAVRIL